MTLKEKLASSVLEALKAVYDLEADSSRIQIQSTRPEFEGTYTFVIFPFIKQIGGNPMDIGNKLGQHLVDSNAMVTGFNVVKGFLNLVISNDQWLECFHAIVENPDFEKGSSTGETRMVEFASPNTNKPLHLGHLRNIFLGDSVSKILEAAGHDVVKTQIINDRGIHICKSMLAWQRFGEGETPSADLKGDKLVGKYYVLFDKEYKKEIKSIVEKELAPQQFEDITASRKTLIEAQKNKSIDEAGSTTLKAINQAFEKGEKEATILIEAQEMLKKWEASDQEVTDLWRKMNGWVYDGFDVTYDALNVQFDTLYYESNTYLTGRDEVMTGLKDGAFYQKEDGSVWVDLEDQKLDHKLLLRSDGTSVYMTQDIGTAILRFKDYPKLSGQVYTVGNEQEHHFKVLFAILKKLGFSWAESCYHLSYGMVDLPSGKMKSREGTVVDADDLVGEMIETAAERTKEKGKISGFTEEQANELYSTLALGALKYFLLKVDPKRRMLFNPAESIEFQGNTGPFIQYTHARIASLLRKAVEEKIYMYSSDSKLPEGDLLSEEGDLIAMMNSFPEVIQEAASAYEPSIVANYIYEVTKSFSKYYDKVPIFKEGDELKRAFRLELSKQVAMVIRKSMKLIGVDVPDRM